jgi:hypothetical protein
LAPVTNSSARRYCGAVAFAGGVLLIGIALDSSASRFDQERTVAILLAAGVLLGELLPLKIPRRGEHEELTVSTSFAFALLLLAGLWPAVAAQSVASVVEDVISRKPLWRVAFNIGQSIGHWPLLLVADDGVFTEVAQAAGHRDRVATLAAYAQWLS